MTEPPIAMLQRALRDITILGKIVQAVAEANTGDGRDVVPSTWAARFGRELTRLTTDARDIIQRGPAA